MKRSFCAAFVSFVALVPLGLGSIETAGIANTIQPSHSLIGFAASTLPHYDAEKAAAKVKAMEETKRKQRAKQARKVAQKRTKQMRIKMARAALMTAKKMHSQGYCYKGVTDALKPLGVELYGIAAYMAKDLLKADPRFKPVRAEDPTQLHPGDVIVHGPTGAHPYGHIAVYLGNNNEASDHVQPVLLNAIGPYSYSVVFRYDEQFEYRNALERIEAAARLENDANRSGPTAEPAVDGKLTWDSASESGNDS